MGDLSSLHSQARKLILQIREGLDVLEGIEAGSRQGDLPAVANDLRKKHAELNHVAHDLETLSRQYVARERDPGKRAVWKGKVEQVVAESAVVRHALDKYGRREDKRAAEQAEREELFSRADQGRLVKTQMDLEAEMQGSVGRSKRVIQEMFEAGNSILGGLSANRERLKAAQRKALDVLNSVGLGDTLLKLIERRQRMDIWLTYGGMVVLLLVVILLMWIFWR